MTGRRRPFAVVEYRDAYAAYSGGGRVGYGITRARYATREAAQREADYTNLFPHTPKVESGEYEPRPAYVVDLDHDTDLPPTWASLRKDA